MDSDEKILHDFFQELKKKDQHSNIPNFEELTVSRTISISRYRLMAAAVIIVLITVSATFWFKTNTKATKSLAKQEVDVLINDSDELISWEEPTQSLLEDF